MKKTTGFLVFSLIALTTGVVLRSDGNVVLAFVPAICFALLQAIWRLPLRYPLLVLTFLVLTLENPSESPAAGLWRSPIYTAGALLLAHMNVTIRASWLIFSGVDVALVLLLAVSLRRWFQDPSRRLDRAGDGGPIRAFALLCLGGAVGMWLWGMARGGADVGSSLWQVQRVVYLPVFCLLFLVALRGREDREALGKVFVVAACFKAALAIYLRLTVEPPPGELVLAYATTHQDSMLFAGAFCLLVAPLLEAFDRRRARRCLLLLPLLAAGMVANHRRIVWVELAAGLAVLLAVTPWTAPKRRLARAALLSSPLALVYLVVGWG
jgi:hypothetical protein